MRYGMAGARDNSSTFIEESGYHILNNGKVTGIYTDGDNFAIAPSTATLEL
jgi:hypothetical protein